MSTVSAESLIHFTKTFKVLKSILSKGLRYSYVLEHFQSYAPIPKELLEEDDYLIEGTAIPMICFCDIPLNLAQKHSDEYGQFFIAFDKSPLKMMLSEKLNPVFYIHSEASRDVLDILDKNREDKRLAVIADFMLAMSKPISGFDLRGYFKDFYNEREWRVFYYPTDNQFCQWYRNVRLKEGDEYRKWIETNNKKLQESEYAYLNLNIHSEDLISCLIFYIGIKDDSYREKMIKFIEQTKTIFGIGNISETTKINLISKIISFDRIKNDF